VAPAFKRRSPSQIDQSVHIYPCSCNCQEHTIQPPPPLCRGQPSPSSLCFLFSSTFLLLLFLFLHLSATLSSPGQGLFIYNWCFLLNEEKAADFCENILVALSLDLPRVFVPTSRLPTTFPPSCDFIVIEQCRRLDCLRPACSFLSSMSLQP
jgi:hypothetical protein